MSRGIEILNYVSSAGRPVTIPEVGEAVKLPKPTAHRICRTLTEMGLLAKDTHPKKLNIGPGFTSMALAALSSTTALGPQRATLRQVVEEVQEKPKVRAVACGKKIVPRSLYRWSCSGCSASGAEIVALLLVLGWLRGRRRR